MILKMEIRMACVKYCNNRLSLILFNRTLEFLWKVRTISFCLLNFFIQMKELNILLKFKYIFVSYVISRSIIFSLHSSVTLITSCITSKMLHINHFLHCHDKNLRKEFNFAFDTIYNHYFQRVLNIHCVIFNMMIHC